MCHELDDVRVLAVRCLHCFWAASSPAAKLATGINDFTLDECSGIADFLGDNPLTTAIYQSLMDFALAIKVRAGAGVRPSRRAWRAASSTAGAPSPSRTPSS